MRRRTSVANSRWILILLAVLCSVSSTQASDFTTVLSFGAPTGSLCPYGDLTLSGSTLYGMTNQGGTLNEGTVFRVNTDGTGFQQLLQFNANNGAYPFGSLTLSGSTLYGMTPTDNSGWGNIFTINTDGTGYQNRVSFSQSYARPYGSLTLSGSKLYGMTSGGGTNYQGSIFSINTDCTGLQNVCSFDGVSGSDPLGSLTLGGSTLYGMTSKGGTTNLGTVFRVKTDGTGFQSLLSFDGTNGANGALDGPSPALGSLTLVGSTLYGMTSAGGANNKGTIFSIDTDGTGFQSLLSFDGSNGDSPLGSLTLVGSTLYGMTSRGGTNYDGTIFSINADGTGFQSLLSFDDYVNGENPMGGLTLSGSTLYGMTEGGGRDGCGTIFALAVPEPSTLVLLGAGAVSLLAYALRRRGQTG